MCCNSLLAISSYYFVDLDILMYVLYLVANIGVDTAEIWPSELPIIRRHMYPINQSRSTKIKINQLCSKHWPRSHLCQMQTPETAHAWRASPLGRCWSDLHHHRNHPATSDGDISPDFLELTGSLKNIGPSIFGCASADFRDQTLM